MKTILQLAGFCILYLAANALISGCTQSEKTKAEKTEFVDMDIDQPDYSLEILPDETVILTDNDNPERQYHVPIDSLVNTIYKDNL